MDLDGDLQPELIIIRRYGGRENIEIYETATWRAIFSHPLNDFGSDIAVADLNNDGFLDIYVVQRKEMTNCDVNGGDAQDLLLFGPKWRVGYVAPTQHGCGHKAESLDGIKVLVSNGGPGWKGDLEIISFEAAQGI